MGGPSNDAADAARPNGAYVGKKGFVKSMNPRSIRHCSFHWGVALLEGPPLP